MGLSENSIPLHPMVLLIIIPIKWLFHWEIYPIFKQTQIKGYAVKNANVPVMLIKTKEFLYPLVN